MNLFFRIAIALYSFLAMVMSTFALFLSIFKKAFVERALLAVSSELNWEFMSKPYMWWIVFLVSALCVAFNLYIFIAGIRGGKERRSIVRETEIGEVCISSTTFENIAANCIRRISGIRDSRANVKIVEGKVSIFVDAVFLSDVNIPMLCEEAQTRIKQNIEQCTSVKVADVRVLAAGVHTVYKGRVE